MYWPKSYLLFLPKHTASFWNIIIQLTSHDDLTEKFVSLVSSAKLGNWKKKLSNDRNSNCTLWFDRKTVSVEFCQLAVLDWDFISIWKPNPCMDPLETKIYCIRIYSILWWASPFYYEWPALIDILMILTFPQKANQNLSRLWPIEAIRSETDLTCRK